MKLQMTAKDLASLYYDRVFAHDLPQILTEIRGNIYLKNDIFQTSSYEKSVLLY